MPCANKLIPFSVVEFYGIPGWKNSYKYRLQFARSAGQWNQVLYNNYHDNVDQSIEEIIRFFFPNPTQIQSNSFAQLTEQIAFLFLKRE